MLLPLKASMGLPTVIALALLVKSAWDSFGVYKLEQTFLILFSTLTQGQFLQAMRVLVISFAMLKRII